MSGHSYGALTTLVAVGQGSREDAPNPYQDPRIDAAIVYSPNAPRHQDPETALAEIRTPILHFTRTEDRTPSDLEKAPEGRTIPFRTIEGADQYLIILTGGDHQIFGGRVQRSGVMTPAQAAQTETIVRGSLIFWRAYLMDDREALDLLCDLPQRVAGVAHGETKASRCTPDRYPHRQPDSACTIERLGQALPKANPARVMSAQGAKADICSWRSADLAPAGLPDVYGGWKAAPAWLA